MTPEQLKNLANESAKAEYEKIISLLTDAAKRGEYSCKLPEISEAARALLTKDGFGVEYRDPMGFGGNYIVTVNND